MGEHRAGVRTEGEGPLLGTLAARLLPNNQRQHRTLPLPGNDSVQIILVDENS
jgi:hypothetical protein